MEIDDRCDIDPHGIETAVTLLAQVTASLCTLHWEKYAFLKTCIIQQVIHNEDFPHRKIWNWLFVTNVLVMIYSANISQKK